MERITLSMDSALLDRLDDYMRASGARNRSEALRDLVRRGLSSLPPRPEADCVAVLSYVMDPAQRDLGRRVPLSRQDHHDRTVAALSAPLDHEGALEVAILRGPVGALSDYANGLFLERGVRHGSLSLIPVRVVSETHAHGSGEAHSHSHVQVQESF